VEKLSIAPFTLSLVRSQGLNVVHLRRQPFLKCCCLNPRIELFKHNRRTERRFALVVALRIQARFRAGCVSFTAEVRPRTKKHKHNFSTAGFLQCCSLQSALRNNLDRLARVPPPHRIGPHPVMLGDQFYHRYQHSSPPFPDHCHCSCLLL
jgi:hypothetical protein